MNNEAIGWGLSFGLFLLSILFYKIKSKFNH